MRAWILCWSALFSIMVPSIVTAEKPFSFKETPGKLPKEVVPTDYSIRIVPKIDQFTFTGTETVKLNVRSPVHQLVLNTLELKIEAASVDGKDLPASAIKTDKEKELLTLTLHLKLAQGDHTLALRFSGKINQQGQGQAELARYALEATAQILPYYDDYFGVPYTLPKLDQIALTGGFGGAMENWGEITYYESRLLFVPENSSTETKQNIYEVIAHE